MISLLRCARRGIATTPRLHDYHRSLAKMKKLQADYQCEDGRPIFLKGGICDRILYGSTLVACATGIFMVLMTIYDHAKPASWKKAC